MKRIQATPSSPWTRRQWLQRTSTGFGWLAASSLLSQAGRADEAEPRRLHHEAKAKNVIFCFMSGGVSHVDTFDPKPELDKRSGEPIPFDAARTQFNNNGSMMGSPWKFRQYGQSGLPVSDLFPMVGERADDLAVVRSMTAKFSEHAQGNFFLHTGFPFLGHPSAGAWVNYGLGSVNENLPGYVVLQAGNATVPHGGVSLFSNGFLSAQYQASILKADGEPPIANVRPREADMIQRRRLDLVQQLDRSFLNRQLEPDHVESAIENYELAYRMQSAVPDLVDLSGETQAMRDLYGLDDPEPQKAAYAQQCLLARRLVESGVRFVELSCLAYNIGGGNGANPWDHHGDLRQGHEKMARQVDQPIAALLSDLKQRGLLDETLVIWAGEFGRTPFSQGGGGRDHDPFGFSIWMAGGGIRGGQAYGATDEFGYQAVEQTCDIYDLWATVLHQLGLDHTRLTYRHGGRDFRLTDVHGRVLDDLLA